MGKPNTFDVFKRMSELDIQSFKLAPNSNFKRANTGKDGFGEVVMAVDNETIMQLNSENPPVFCLLIWDGEEFKRVEDELR